MSFDSSSNPTVFSCAKPRKAINSDEDLARFLKSPAYEEIANFVKSCAEAVVGRRCRPFGEASESPVVQKFSDFMDRGFALIDDVPPLKQPMRFGNKAFRTWLQQMETEAPAVFREMLPPEQQEPLGVELLAYAREMFGNDTRIDYGTGHELNFAIFFLVLLKRGVIAEKDLSEVVLHGFVHYVRLMRRLQVDYMLEPAGSHGVWGLDDYHCLLFLWGAAQLSATEPPPAAPANGGSRVQQPHEEHHLHPECIRDAGVLREHAAEYLYIEGVAFIRRIKHGAPFAETSPMLHDISGMGSWGKICAGLMRLFQGEVMNKFQVIQHLKFGAVLQATW